MTYIFEDQFNNHDQATIAMHECNLNDNYAGIGCIPEFLKFIKIMFKRKKL